MDRHPGYCPLCGNTSLALVEKAGKVWAYCDQGGLTFEQTHTRFVVAEAEKAPTKKKESE